MSATATTAGSPRTAVIREVTLLGTSVVLYFLVRGLIDTRIHVAYRNAEHVVALERTAGAFVEPRLQRAVVGHEWLADAVSYVYIYGHWPVLTATFLWLLVRHRDEYARFRNAMLISGAIALVVFATFPVAPPRFLTGYGFVDTVTQETSAYRVLQPPAFVNQYAAVPSLHFGWNLLAGIAWASLARHRLARVLGWLMPAAMLAAIVLTANHYLFDGLIGGALALFGLYVATSTLLRPGPARAVTPAVSRAEGDPHERTPLGADHAHSRVAADP